MIVQTIKVSNCTPQTIVIGRRGTYDTLQIAFDLSYLVESYGNGVAVLAVKRSQDESAYPAVTSQEDDLLLWTVSETDTFYVGAGETQLMWYVDGGLAKTIIYPMVVMKDILMTSEEAPDAYQEWVDSLIAEGAETLQNAQDAAQSATDAENAKDDAVTAKEAAEAILEEFTTPTASATTLPAGSQATATYSDGNFDFGIPRGADGDPGAPGVTPDFSIGTVTTLEPTQPATATITGTAEAPVLNLGIPKGAKGDPGQGGGSVNSVNGKTGDVVLDAGDLEFDDTETYAAGSIGAEVSAQKNAINAKAPVIISTASGDIATFDDGADGMPIKHLAVNIEAVQDLHGQAYPYPAGGGVNQWDEEWELGGIDTNGENETSSNHWRTKNYIPVVPGSTYYFASKTAGEVILRIRYYGDNKAYLGNTPSAYTGMSVVIPDDCHYIRFSPKNSDIPNHDVSVNYPSTDTSYHPYSNECPITGWTGLTGARTGVNLWDEEIVVGGYYNGSGEWVTNPNVISSKNYIPVKPHESVYVYLSEAAPADSAIGITFWTADKSIISRSQQLQGTVVEIPDDCYYILFNCNTNYGTTYNHDISINYPANDTEYHAYQGNTISVSWATEAGTVYGGTLDMITGVLTVTHAEIDLGTLNWASNTSLSFQRFFANIDGKASGQTNVICSQFATETDPVGANQQNNTIKGISSTNAVYVRADEYSDVATFKAAVSGAQLIYELATPQTYQLDPITVETLLGNNTVYVDCGSVTVDYPADTGIVVAQQSNAIDQKQDAPSSAGTAGQVLGLDSNLDPVWVNQSGGGDVSNCAPIIINTASGDVASFADGADNRQIRKIVGTIVPVQSGTGDPSPDNVRPISGWTGCEIGHAGANMFNPLSAIFKSFEGSSTWDSANGKISLKVNAQQVGLLYAVKPNTTYRIGANKPSSGGSTLWSAYEYTDIPINIDDYLVSAPTPVAISNAQYLTITTTSETNYICFYFKKSSGTGAATVSDIWVSIDQSCTSYAPYVPVQTIPINWQTEAGTIYGGTVTLYENESVDVVVKRGMADLGDFTYTKTAISGTEHYYFTSNNNSLPNALGNENYSGCGAICEQYKDSIGLLNKIDNSFSIYEVAHRVNIQDYSKDNYTVAEFKAAMAGIKLVYLLVTPQTYHFDNIGELYTYFGTNNVWIDTGAITECDYPADTKLYIDGLTAPDEDMIANANIASGKYFVVNNQLYLSTAAIAAGASIVPGTNCTATNLAEALNALNT